MTATTNDGALLLGGDVGGTKTLLALAGGASDSPAILFQRRYASREQSGFQSMLDGFLAEARAEGIATDRIARACFGVAGPISGRTAKPTYLPWTLDADAIAARHGMGDALLVNDFAAAAAGILTLPTSELVALQDGQREDFAPRAVLGAGTGLGVAFLIWTGVRWQVIPGEGGHVGFAPADEEQIALWRCFAARYGRVSAERVVSGAGIEDIYRCLVASGAPPHHPDPLLEQDVPNAISGAAAHGATTPGHAVDLFVRAYGAFAGDMALTVMARGGVYLAGGIAPKILPLLQQGAFCEAFNAKMGHSILTRSMPVHVVTNQQLGLQGAVWLAGQAQLG